MKFFRSRRGLLLLAGVVLLALFLVRPGAQRLKARIVTSISAALGRPVEISSVNLRLLPRPGFDLENFVVYDGPSFGAEPFLRAEEVTAVLRVQSLLRGRIEIARLSLVSPSINLARNAEGRWNLEGLLERADQIAVAPTSRNNAGPRPGFPYVEADGARINFKLLQEKKPYVLTDAEFSLWQDSENTWAMRLKAQPMRTDFSLSDTGAISVTGSWQRSASLRDTPVTFHLSWDKPQLGQVTKLVYGSDKGWRGRPAVSVDLTGTPADLNIAADASVEDFRRYDIVGGAALHLAAHCSAHYSSGEHQLSNLSCRAPVGEGSVWLEGGLTRLSQPIGYNLTVTAEKVPMQALVTLARHAKKGLPDDMLASGTLSGSAKLERTVDSGVMLLAWNGGGEAKDLQIVSKLAKTDLSIDRVPISLSERAKLGVPAGAPALSIGPVNVPMGRPSPVAVSATITRPGYEISLHGEADLQKLLRTARAFGVPAAQPAATGTAKIGLRIVGQWADFAAPRVTGDARLQSVRAEIRGVNAPLTIASADVTFAADRVEVQNVKASLGETAWRGSLTLPRDCGSPAACSVHFDFRADEITTAQIGQLFGPRQSAQAWYRFLSAPAQASPYLSGLHAAGKLSADRVMVHRLLATHVTANVELEAGKLRLSQLHGDVLGGKHSGEWKADFNVRPPAYTGSGNFERVSLAQLAEGMHDGWVSGTAGGSYHATASGLTVADLVSSANATIAFEARDGAFPHLNLADAPGPLRMRRLEGQVVLRDGKLTFPESKLETPAGIYLLSGTVSLARALDLKLTRDVAHSFGVTGTLNVPKVAPMATPETRAELKP